jgi:hypothetical protein
MEFHKQIQQYLLEKCKDQKSKDQLSSVLNDIKRPVAFIVSERMLNVNPHLAPHMYKLLFEEIETIAKEDVS